MDAPAQAGHFTTFQVRDGAVRGLDLHFARLGDATRAMCGHDLDLADLRARLRQAIAGEAGQGCTVRVVVASGSAPRIEIEAPREPGERPLRLQSRCLLRAEPQFKHLAIAPQLDARRQAQSAGFDDALLVDGGGLVAEGSFWNIGFIGGGGVTWPLAPALRGVTERLLQASLARAGVAQRVCAVRLDEVAGYRAAFATNSRGVQEIASIDGHVFGAGPGPDPDIRAAFEAITWQAP
jgi:branched-subunit amino acid aminotransferase/4-amino-4-deoxychorismate lyase